MGHILFWSETGLKQWEPCGQNICIISNDATNDQKQKMLYIKKKLQLCHIELVNGWISSSLRQVL